MSLIKNKVFVLTLTALATFSTVQAAELTTSFQGWIGRQQKSEFVDPSSWFACYNDRGGACVTGSQTVGTSQCHDESFDLGASFELPAPAGWGLFSLSGSKSSSWSSCHEKSETVQCTPKVGFQGRAVALMSERWGTLKVTGGTPQRYTTGAGNSCPTHWTGKLYGNGRVYVRNCEYTGGTFNKVGYLPEYTKLTCDYQKL